MIGYLVLENGDIFEGERIGYNVDTACEVVFNTGMVGYVETFTDPSYAGQGIVMTYPLIGNYGIIPEDSESDKIWAKAIFIHDLAEFESNFRTKQNLDKFLKDFRVPGLTNVNTRKLTKVLRNSGTMKGYLTSNISNMNEIKERIKAYTVGNVLLKRDVEVTVFPANTTAEKIIAFKPDGIMLSNGPGDPKDCEFQIRNLKKLYEENIPILGICLGHQLMGIATGAKTAKLKYGHRGPNHPVKDIKKDRVYITSQNHGYYILEESVNPKIAEVSHINLNDKTVEGLRYKNKKICTVQFHPEACPGPEDTAYIFDDFVMSL